jgi:phage tail-like protein
MDEQQAFYLNLANEWPGFERRGLQIDGDGSLTLARVPGFSDIVGAIRPPLRLPAEPAGVASDDAGDIYLTDPGRHWLVKLEACSGRSRRLPCLGGRGTGAGQFNRPRGLLVGHGRRLYIADSGNHRVQVVDLPTGGLLAIWGRDPPQPSAEIGLFDGPWGLAEDGAGYVYVVERGGRRVQKFDGGGAVVPAFWDALGPAAAGLLIRPSYLALGTHGGKEQLYLLDVGLHEVLVVSTSGELLARWPLPAGMAPVGIAATGRAVYIGDAHAGQLLQFNPDGRPAGATPDHRGAIAALGTWCDQYLLWHPGVPTGVARLRLDAAFVLEGSFVTGPVDSSAARTTWGRLQAMAEPLAEDAHLQLFTLTGEQPAPIADLGQLSPADGWQALPADVFDALVLNPPGRYLWIGGRLWGCGHSSPRLAQMRVRFPPDSYLRYLPAIYSEEEQSRRLLEQMLALFESVLDGVEGEIDGLPALFDPWAAPTGWAPWLAGWGDRDRAGSPPDWLPWLARWLALDIDQSWREEQTRRALAQAFELYGMRGTIEGLRRMIKAFTGVEAVIEDAGRFASLWLLDEASTLGFDTVLGRAREAEVVPEPPAAPVNPLLAAAVLAIPLTCGSGPAEAEVAPLPLEEIAYRFFVRVYRSELAGPRTLPRIRALLDREKPAHTEYELCVIEPRFRVGCQATLGVDAIVGGPLAGFALDAAQPLGMETALAGDDTAPGLIIGARTRLGRERLLA